MAILYYDLTKEQQIEWNDDSFMLIKKQTEEWSKSVVQYVNSIIMNDGKVKVFRYTNIYRKKYIFIW